MVPRTPCVIRTFPTGNSPFPAYKETRRKSQCGGSVPPIRISYRGVRIPRSELHFVGQMVSSWKPPYKINIEGYVAIIILELGKCDGGWPILLSADHMPGGMWGAVSFFLSISHRAIYAAHREQGRAVMRETHPPAIRRWVPLTIIAHPSRMSSGSQYIRETSSPQLGGSPNMLFCNDVSPNPPRSISRNPDRYTFP